jgi:hypothetical protein
MAQAVELSICDESGDYFFILADPQRFVPRCREGAAPVRSRRNSSDRVRMGYEYAQAFPALQVPAVGMPLLSTSADLAPQLRALQPPRTRSSRVGIT